MRLGSWRASAWLTGRESGSDQSWEGQGERQARLPEPHSLGDQSPIVLILKKRKWWLPVVRGEHGRPPRLAHGLALPDRGAAFYNWASKEGPDPFL